ncbi:unnamed protein product [Camellia sinensis]
MGFDSLNYYLSASLGGSLATQAMAPNPRVARAFRAMRSIGIIEEKVKPVLKNLLKLYDKNWELIEEENYRALADAIFDQEETQTSEQKKKHENTDMHEEPERPLKRLHLRNQNDHVSPYFGLGETSSRGPPKVEEPLVRNKGKQPVLPKPVSIQNSFEPSQPGAADRTEPFATRRTESDLVSPLVRHTGKGKEPLLPQIAPRISVRSPHAVRLKEPMVDTGIVHSPKLHLHDSRALIKPKDEPFTDDILQSEVPSAVIHGEPLSKENSSNGEARNDGVLASSNERRTACKLANNVDGSSSNLDVASSHYGEVFMTPRGKGWGLRTLEDLPKGAFVCEYVGEILTNAELFKQASKSPSSEEHACPVLLDADWGSEGVLKDGLCLDATHYGNVARFINHRCFNSNLVEIPVEVETPDHHYYHLAFFTSRKVQALEELTWDYGIDFDDHDHPVKAFKCRCGTKFCRNIKRSSRLQMNRAVHEQARARLG